jgi:hypothetical protein
MSVVSAKREEQVDGIRDLDDSWGPPFLLAGCFHNHILIHPLLPKERTYPSNDPGRRVEGSGGMLSLASSHDM